METKENKIEAIRRACIAANESILALEFGCEIRKKFDEWELETKILASVGVCGKHKLYRNCNEDCYRDGHIDDGYLILEGHEEEGFYTDKILTGELKEKYEIIGRPIRLADVLLAIGQKASYYGPYDGELAMTTSQPESKSTWNLFLDDLTLQSEPTITFIHSLIKS